MARTAYGVRISGCSGAEMSWVSSRGAADRIRRALRAHAARGGWTGWRTLGALADLALEMRGARTADILAEFDRRGRLLRAAEDCDRESQLAMEVPR